MLHNQKANEGNLAEATEKTPLLPGGNLLAKCRVMIIVSLGQAGLLYSAGVVGFVLPLLEESLSPATTGAIASALLIGAICGQMIFGLLADLLGPKLAGLVSASCALFGVCLATSAGIFGPLGAQLIVSRFFIGMGTGGEYPVAASLTASMKQTIVEPRLLLLAAYVFAHVSSSLYYLIICLGQFANAPAELVWRCLLAGGGLPAVLCLFFRSGLDPTELKTVPSIEHYGHELSQSFKGKKLEFFALCVSWGLSHMLTGATLAFCPVVYQEMLALTDSSADVLQTAPMMFFTWLMGLGLALFAKPISEYMTMKGMAATFTLISALLLSVCAISFQYAWAGLSLLSWSVLLIIGVLPAAALFPIAGEMFGASTVGFYVGVAVTFAKACSALSQFLFPVLLDHFGLSFDLLMTSMCAFGSFLSMMLCIIASRGHARAAAEEHLA